MGSLALIAYGVAFVGSCLAWVLLLAGTGKNTALPLFDITLSPPRLRISQEVDTARFKQNVIAYT